MNNYNYTRPPRKGVIVFVSFVFTAIFGIAFFSAYEQRTDLGHSVHLSPTSANYGTVSSVHPQALAVPMQSSAPMLSGGAIRSSAYSGHATMPKTGSSGSGFKMYTTSSASVHSIGSGGGGSMSGSSSSGGSSSKGIQYSGGSISMPTLALATPSYGAQSFVSRGGGFRRIPGREGDFDTEVVTDEYGTWTWDEELKSWLPAEGAIKIEGGKTYQYIGGGWVEIVDQQDPGLPIGDAPWHWMLLLAIAYVCTKVLRKRIESLSSITID